MPPIPVVAVEEGPRLLISTAEALRQGVLSLVGPRATSRVSAWASVARTRAAAAAVVVSVVAGTTALAAAVVIEGGVRVRGVIATGTMSFLGDFDNR